MRRAVAALACCAVLVARAQGEAETISKFESRNLSADAVISRVVDQLADLVAGVPVTPLPDETVQDGGEVKTQLLAVPAFADTPHEQRFRELKRHLLLIPDQFAGPHPKNPLYALFFAVKPYPDHPGSDLCVTQSYEVAFAPAGKLRGALTPTRAYRIHRYGPGYRLTAPPSSPLSAPQEGSDKACAKIDPRKTSFGSAPNESQYRAAQWFAQTVVPKVLARDPSIPVSCGQADCSVYLRNLAFEPLDWIESEGCAVPQFDGIEDDCEVHWSSVGLIIKFAKSAGSISIRHVELKEWIYIDGGARAD